MPYSKVFKSQMVKKMCGPDAVSATALSKKVNISQTTLSRWLREAVITPKPFDIKLKFESRENEMNIVAKRPEDWTAEEKINAVVEARTLSDSDLGAFLRRKGLHEAHIEGWGARMLAGVSGEASDREQKKQTASLNRRIRELEKELDRKDKALAEAAALLVLKKKARRIWGDEGSATTAAGGKKSLP